MDVVIGKVILVVEYLVKMVCFLWIVFSGYLLIIDENIYDKKLNKIECFEYVSVFVEGFCNYLKILILKRDFVMGVIDGKM